MRRARVQVGPNRFEVRDVPDDHVEQKPSIPFQLQPCIHLGGKPIGAPCGSVARICTLDGLTTSQFVKCDKAAKHCPTCEDKVLVKWSYGVTTVPSRFDTYLGGTLRSLAEAGFDEPRLFVDGCKEADLPDWLHRYQVTCRYPAVKGHANWMLSAQELYYRDRQATHFAIFQDDILAAKGLRKYLSCELDERCYYNLFTMPPPAQAEPPTMRGWFKSNQRGRGAVALVFRRQTFMELLSARHMVDRFQDAQKGDKNFDGGIVSAMTKAGVIEMVHNPSLVQHVGDESAIGNKKHPKAETFDVNCLRS